MTDLRDRRQRLAAALCLASWGGQLKQASSVCPGVTLGEIPTNSRREALSKARDTLNELISECA